MELLTKKIIVISGMTGVGKTNIARILAKHINGEIISADAQQVILFQNTHTFTYRSISI
jgi:tRNA A37 N6-isopentenylltransferase MiaA